MGTREICEGLDKETVICWLGLWQWAAGLHPNKWRCKLQLVCYRIL